MVIISDEWCPKCYRNSVTEFKVIDEKEGVIWHQLECYKCGSVNIIVSNEKVVRYEHEKKDRA